MNRPEILFLMTVSDNKLAYPTPDEKFNTEYDDETKSLSEGRHDTQDSNSEKKTGIFWTCIPKRFIVTFLAFIGMILLFFLRTNVSVAVIEMSSNKTVKIANETVTVPAEFEWTSLERGFIISAYSIGYTFAFLGGLFIHKIKGVTMFGGGLLISAIIATITPQLVHLHLYTFIIGRIALGGFEGFARLSLVDIFAYWAPKKERVRLISIAYTGGLCGASLNYPLSGFIISNFGWPALFYISGGVTILWCCIWLFFVGNGPSDDRFISKTERSFILQETNISGSKISRPPFKKIFTSVPVYAILNEFLVASHTISFTTMCLPLYIKAYVQLFYLLYIAADVYNVDIQTVGLLSGIPMFCSICTVPFAGYIADRLRLKYSYGKVHRWYLFWGQSITLIFFFIAAMSDNLITCIICFSCLKISYSLADTSYSVITIDMAGQYCGFLKSLSSSAAGVGFFLNPIIMGLFIPNRTQAEWNHYFLFMSCLTMYGVIIFLIFGSGELQSWAKVTVKQMKMLNE